MQKNKKTRGTSCFKVYPNSQTLSIPLTQENIWNDLLMGHHLPPSFSYILHRKNTGRCPLYLDARKFNQCNWHVYFSTDTGNNYQAFISKTLLAFPIRFCDKVTSWGNILYRTNGIMSKQSWMLLCTMHFDEHPFPVPSSYGAGDVQISVGIKAP